MKTQGEVKELLQSLSLEAGEEKEFSITIKEEDLRFILADGTWGTEAGLYRIYIGNETLEVTQNMTEA